MFSEPFISVTDSTTGKGVMIPLDKIESVEMDKVGDRAFNVNVYTPNRMIRLEHPMGTEFVAGLLRVKWIRDRTMQDVLNGHF